MRRRTAARTASTLALCLLEWATGGPGLRAQAPSSTVSTSSDPPPSAPAVVTATALSSSEVLVDWSPVTDAEGGVDHYKVYRDGTHVGSPTTVSFTDTGLQPATEYTYEVSAVDSKNREGKKSEPVSVTTLPGDDDDDDDDGDDGDDDDGDDTPPTKPQNLQADAVGPRQVDLAWDAASDPESGVDHYQVYRDGQVIASPSGTSFSDTGVDPETSYAYEVSAVNGEGLEGQKSDAATVTTPAEDDGDGGGDDGDSTAPTQPQNLQADAVGPRRVDLAWTAASDLESGVAFYNVYRDGRVVGTPAGNAFSDTGVEAETSYTYRVSAVNGEGLESRRSDAATATTPALTDTTPPAPPTRLRIMNVRSGSP